MSSFLFGVPAIKSDFSASLNSSLFAVSNTSDNLSGDRLKIYKSNHAPELEVTNFNVKIGDQHILKDVCLNIPDKKITCIIGPSGCGKSTLLKSFNRLLDEIENVQISGQVLIDGVDIYNRNTEVTSVRKKMGLLSQRPCPLPMSIIDNVTYGCRIHGLRKRKVLAGIAERQLKAVGLWDEVKDRLNSSASKLSIGQQQRLCLARGLAVEPDFILADEATSALDPMSSKLVEDLFVKLKEEYAIVMVTHTLRQARRIADHVIFMYLGEIIEQGPADQIFNNPTRELTKKYVEGAFS